MHIPFLEHQFLFVKTSYYVQVIGNGLKTAVPAAHAHWTFHIVLGQKHLYGMPAVSPDSWTVGINHHAFFHYIIARCYQTALTFHFYDLL